MFCKLVQIKLSRFLQVPLEGGHVPPPQFESQWTTDIVFLQDLDQWIDLTRSLTSLVSPKDWT